ncbi:hypothetical protein [Bradyrhizobium sp. BR 10261]|uniref:hypothetical protein n=1 Tax=Bradyrhizobium sp. BR 10261 TaxID=2749992 RepID=UPI001C644F30|nr:hypothetical protein [Bradyrhizobium sp. BR 10261]MBW7966031.1 hypothetical protein [Bradyrhizobium sp. BR 10261]
MLNASNDIDGDDLGSAARSKSAQLNKLLKLTPSQLINSGASIHHFFLGGNNVIEYAIGSDGNGYNLTTLLSPSARPALSTEHAPVSFDGHELQQVHALPLQHDLLV